MDTLDERTAPTIAAQERQSLVEALFQPRSVAVIGASTDPAKYGFRVAEQVLRGTDRRRVHLVNRSGGDILGHAALTSIAELPEPPELAVLCVPATGVLAAVEEILELGTRSFVCISAGFSEIGADGERLETEIVQAIRRAGAALVGPNCLGVFDAEAGLECLPWAECAPGAVGLIAQSGTVIGDLDRRLRAAGLGFSRVTSLGNQADVTTAELVRNLTANERTTVIALYCEDFRDGRELMQAVADAIRSDRQVVILSAGSEPAMRAAVSHTGALGSHREVVEAACRAAGATLVRTCGEMADLIQAWARSRRATGRRVGIVSDSGGMTVLAAEALSDVGLSVPALSDGAKRALAPQLPERARPDNPVDLAGSVPPATLQDVGRFFASLPELDAVQVALTDTAGESDEEEAALARGLAAALTTAKPVVVSSLDVDSPTADVLRESGFPVYRDLEAAARALAALCAPEPHPHVPDLIPAKVSGLTCDAGYFAARDLLSSAGVGFAEAAEVGSRDEAIAAGRRLGYPLVLKWLGALHKSDAGGVVLDITTEAELESAFVEMQQRLPASTYSVERMLPRGRHVDLIVGAKQDHRFGPVVLVGMGGVFTEIFSDVVVLLAPATLAQCEAAIGELRGAAVLTGARGTSRLDTRAAAAVAVAVGQLAAEYPDIAEVEVNPLRVRFDGAVALDARVVVREEGRAADLGGHRSRSVR